MAPKCRPQLPLACMHACCLSPTSVQPMPLLWCMLESQVTGHATDADEACSRCALVPALQSVLSATKVIQNFYTFSFLAVAAVLFLGNPKLIQDNLRPRMLYGYCIFACALVVPALVSLLVGQGEHGDVCSAGAPSAVLSN